MFNVNNFNSSVHYPLGWASTRLSSAAPQPCKTTQEVPRMCCDRVVWLSQPRVNCWKWAAVLGRVQSVYRYEGGFGRKKPRCQIKYLLPRIPPDEWGMPPLRLLERIGQDSESNLFISLLHNSWIKVLRVPTMVITQSQASNMYIGPSESAKEKHANVFH